MLSLEVRNLGEFIDSLDKWVADVEKLAEKVARGLSVQIFEQTLQNSVQYSGDFAANWNYSINVPDTTFTPGAVVGPDQFADYKFGKEPNEGKFKAFISLEDIGRSNADAIMYAIKRNRGKDKSFKLGDTIYLTNAAHHDEPYAAGIEEGTIKLRSSGNHRPLGRAVDHIMSYAAGTSSITGNAVIDPKGMAYAMKKTQIDTLRRRGKYD